MTRTGKRRWMESGDIVIDTKTLQQQNSVDRTWEFARVKEDFKHATHTHSQGNDNTPDI